MCVRACDRVASRWLDLTDRATPFPCIIAQCFCIQIQWCITAPDIRDAPSRAHARMTSASLGKSPEPAPAPTSRLPPDQGVLDLGSRHIGRFKHPSSDEARRINRRYVRK